MEVARKLSDTFDVTVLLGDAIPGRIEFPDNVQTVLLPSLGIDPDTNVFDIQPFPGTAGYHQGPAQHPRYASSSD